ncbi:MAG: 30S ribosomal protein S20 [Syntrophaceae bacterium PtaU1.Bin231]|nr:MAG: 30S ribosomal protein S20 [Syntrophaceae bacterium PtaU1.Bin231]HOG17507.1 30S ribosomal protein S20 [Syntrophales bacterium]
MLKHRSAQKRARQSVKITQRNASAKSAVKTKVKAVVAAAEAKDVEAAKKALGVAVPALARSAAKGTIHKRNASRKISRLTKAVNALAKK